MSLKSKDEDPPIKPKALAFLLAIAGRLDAQAHLAAEKLDKNHIIYDAYNILDGASTTFSMFRFVFEVFISNTNDSEVLRNIMASPAGIVGIGLEMLFLTSFAFLASWFDDGTDAKKNILNAIKHFIVISWPYFRDLLKGFKNAYKECKTVAQILAILGASIDVKFLLIPVALALGVIAAANRLWLLTMRNERKKMFANNKKALVEFQGLNTLSREMHKNKLKDIHYQSREKRIKSYLSVGFGGLFDGVYLYAAIPTLAILTPTAFFVMVAFSTCYAVVCMISRVYDEYIEQLRFKATQTRCKLTLVSKELETTYLNLLTLQRKANKSAKDRAKICSLKSDIVKLIDYFDALNKKLKYQTNNSYLSMILLGLRNGLFSYGVLASLLFTVVIVFSVTPMIFSPALLIACISSGLVFIIALSAYYLRNHYKQMKSEKNLEDDSLDKLMEIKERIQGEVNPEYLFAQELELKKSLKNAINFKITPKNDFQEWFEIIRSFFSGTLKGYNFVIFARIPFNKPNPQTHTHDYASPVEIFAYLSAALFCVILVLRALARGLKPEKSKPIPVAPCKASDTPKTKVGGESSAPAKASSDSLFQKPTLLRRLNFFFKPPPPKPKSKLSTPDLSKVQGLV
jgi:hypothetical protein